jgi:FixJ family two-component response regulator
MRELWAAGAFPDGPDLGRTRLQPLIDANVATTVHRHAGRLEPDPGGVRRAPRRDQDDEVFLTIHGERHYLWRAVDQEGNILDLLVQRWRDKQAAKRFFRTGHGDIPMTVQAMKAGAVEFLTKPFRDQDLLDAIAQAMARDRVERQQRADLAALRQRYKLLTSREREVMPLVVAGGLNKQIAADLGTSEIAITLHRGQAILKMQAESLAELVRMAATLGLPATRY